MTAQIVWKKKKPLENYEEGFINDVICAKFKSVSLKVFCVKDPAKKNLLFVIWIASDQPSKNFYVSGEIHCAKDKKKPAYNLAKKRVEVLVRFWCLIK